MAEICADGKAVGTGLTLLARRHGGEAMPTAKTVSTVAPVPMAFLLRRLACWLDQNGPVLIASTFRRRYRGWPLAP
jgi:hypothetical protein